MFRFASPHMLWLLILVPLLIAGFLYAVRLYRRRLARFGDPATLEGLMPDASPARVRHKFILSVIALGVIVVALAQPQFGSKLKEVSREGIEIMLAVDVSNSMLAQDFEPNRLERTKFAINRLLQGLKEDRVGLIAFAGDAYVQLPITSDYTAARNFAAQLSTDIISTQGTAIGAAIDLASKSYSSDSEGSRVLILISDGENHEDDAIEAAKRAAKQGIKIFTIGIGTPEGAPIQIGSEFIKDENGQMVVTKLDEAALEQIALATDGAYIRATSKSIGLEEIITRINQTERKKMTSQIFEEFNEQFQYLLGIALLLLFIELYMLSRKNRILARFNIFNRK